MKKKRDDEYFNLEDLKIYRTLPGSKKLKFLEESFEFFSKATPPESKRAWQALQLGKSSSPKVGKKATY